MKQDYDWGEAVDFCKDCGCVTPVEDLNEDGNCPDCQKKKEK